MRRRAAKRDGKCLGLLEIPPEGSDLAFFVAMDAVKPMVVRDDAHRYSGLVYTAVVLSDEQLGFDRTIFAVFDSVEDVQRAPIDSVVELLLDACKEW